MILHLRSGPVPQEGAGPLWYSGSTEEVKQMASRVEEQTMRLMRFQTKYSSHGEVEIKFGQYINGDIAIQVVDGFTGELITMPTVNLEAYGLRPHDKDHVFIADYAENEGVARVLMDNSIIEVFDPIRDRQPFGPFDASAINVRLSEDSLAVIEDEKRRAGVL